MMATAKKRGQNRKVRAEAVMINVDRCKGCGFCIAFCPTEVLETSESFTPRGYHPPRVVDLKACTTCDFCRLICPEFAIFSVRAKREKPQEEGSDT